MTNDEILQAAKVERDRIVTEVMLSHTEEVDGFSYRWFARRIADEVAAIIEKRTIERCAIPDNALQAIKDACSEAMHYTLAARIPECGNFGEIAQNLSFALQEIAAIRKLGEQ